MGTAMQLVFPAAILGSLILASFGYTVMARVPFEQALGNSKIESSSEELHANVADEGNNSDANSETRAGGEKSNGNENCGVSQKYPESITKWCGLITKHAMKNNIHPDLLAALIWQESGGNPAAYSRSGAVGLMQVMPRDGLAASFMCVNGPCFTNRPSIQELQDPQFNVKYGSGMLAGLVKKYGDTREALKYYGPMDVGYYYADKVLGIFNKYSQ
jgi:hypothetical protein